MSHLCFSWVLNVLLILQRTCFWLKARLWISSSFVKRFDLYWELQLYDLFWVASQELSLERAERTRKRQITECGKGKNDRSIREERSFLNKADTDHDSRWVGWFASWRARLSLSWEFLRAWGEREVWIRSNNSSCYAYEWY